MKKMLFTLFALLTALLSTLPAFAAEELDALKTTVATGDNSNSKLALWLVIGAGAVIVLCIILALTKKKK